MVEPYAEDLVCHQNDMIQKIDIILWRPLGHGGRLAAVWGCLGSKGLWMGRHDDVITCSALLVLLVWGVALVFGG